MLSASEDTEEVVYTGDVITALEHGASQSGTVRVRCELGWVSVTGSNGQPVLTPTEDDTVTVGRQLSPEEQAAEAAAAEEAEEEAWRQRLLAGHYMYSHKSLTSMTEEQIVASSPRDGPNRPGSRVSTRHNPHRNLIPRDVSESLIVVAVQWRRNASGHHHRPAGRVAPARSSSGPRQCSRRTRCTRRFRKVHSG